VAQRDDRALAHVLDDGGREHLGDQAHVAMHAHGLAVGDRYACRLLASVLKREHPEVGDVRDVDPASRADPEDAAH
jgi:hypothetical protein